MDADAVARALGVRCVHWLPLSEAALVVTLSIFDLGGALFGSGYWLLLTITQLQAELEGRPFPAPCRQ